MTTTNSGVQTGRRADAPAAATRSSPLLVATMALAQFGLFVALLAPVTVSLALKVQGLVDGGRAATMTGNILGWAAWLALLANPLVGRLSDHTMSRFGRRRPWMVAGAGVFLLGMAIIGMAGNVVMVLLGWCLGQVGGNMILAPLLATIADQIPPAHRGRVAGTVGMMQSVGVLVAAYVARWFLGHEFWMFVAPAIFAVLTVIVYCAVLPDVPLRQRPPRSGWRGALRTLWLDPRKHPDFAWAWASRFCIILAQFLFIDFRLFFLQDRVHLTTGRAVAVLTTGLLIHTAVLVTFAVLGGWISDRSGRRKPLVFAACALVGVGTLLLVTTHSVGLFYLIEIIMGAGLGIYAAADGALTIDVLPDADNPGNDLGIMNIAQALPQSLAGWIGAALLGLGGAAAGTNYSALFWGAGLAGLLGALLIVPVRSVK